ncbi:hypothetical protein V1264_012466 [Littorina saxatilis]|uniref:Uncharacterized protein n=1 Tax=Littorina saxatilis TaxID=31220 RepID=A0AAN9GLZ9_9CAEN
MARILAALCLLLACMCVTEGFLHQSEYIHMDQPCPPEEKCPRRPDAVCKMDCIEVDAQGKGNDCVYHFYDAAGTFVPCWF